MKSPKLSIVCAVIVLLAGCGRDLYTPTEPGSGPPGPGSGPPGSGSGLAGPPAAITKIEGDNWEGDVGDTLTSVPTVVVQDADGNRVAGVPVTFSVTSGGGWVYPVGGDGADYQHQVQATDGTGTARVEGWHLGPTPGQNTLEASVAGLAGVTFTAVTVNRCTGSIPYVFGTTVSGTLSSESCRLWGGEYSDRYSISASATMSLEFDMVVSGFSSHLSLLDASGAPVKWDTCGQGYCGETSSLRILLGAGDYLVGASGLTYDYFDNEFGAGGPYTFSSKTVPEDARSCGGDLSLFIVPGPGVTTEQRIETSDCEDTFSFHSSTYAYYYDRFGVYLTAGRTYTISMSSGEFDTYLEVPGVGVNDNFGGSSNSAITITPTTSREYLVKAGTQAVQATGSYTISITQGG
jgi:hypothetical protein